MRIRPARPAETIDVRRVLDAAMLEPGDVDRRVAAGDVLVAVEPADVDADAGDDSGDRVLGAIVLEPRDRGAHVAAIAVRRRRRDQGIGRALVECALEREGRLTARFDDRVRPFYEGLAFSIEPIDGERHEGVRTLEE